MASGDKKGKGEKNDKSTKESGASMKDAAAGFLTEVERTGESLLGEVRELFDSLSEKVSGVASAAAQTTASVAEKVAIKEPAQMVRGLLDDVRDAGEASLQAIGEGFDALRHRVAGGADAVELDKKAKKKGDKKGKKAKAKSAEKGSVEENVAPAEAVEAGVAQTAGAAVGVPEPVGKKAGARGSVVKKAVAKKVVARKTVARKTVAKQTRVRTSPAAGTATKKTAVRKTAAKKATPPRRPGGDT